MTLECWSVPFVADLISFVSSCCIIPLVSLDLTVDDDAIINDIITLSYDILIFNSFNSNLYLCCQPSPIHIVVMVTVPHHDQITLYSSQ